MDGYAVRAADTAEPPRIARSACVWWPIWAAGYVAEREVTEGTAIRIMTGAPIPAGADSIVPFEQNRFGVEVGGHTGRGGGGRQYRRYAGEDDARRRADPVARGPPSGPKRSA
jgi:molybdopterin molybdotransferase